MAFKSTGLKSIALKLPVLHKQLAVLSALALGISFNSFARADCTLDSPIFVSAFGYDYLNPLVQAVQFPFLCDTNTPVSYTVRSSGGSLEAVTNNWLGSMHSGVEQLNYFVPQSTGSTVGLANIRTILNFPVVVPASQWNAPSLTYGDTLTITLTF
jgi:hypothetical protein